MARKTKALKNNLVKNEPHLVDIHVGKRIKLARKMTHMNQVQLADILGLTFQQIQKYEKGTNRVSASRLWELSQVFGLPVGFFFENMEKDGQPILPGLANNLRNIDNKLNNDFMLSVNDRELLREYKRILDPQLSDVVLTLVKTIVARDGKVTTQPVMDSKTPEEEEI